MKYVNNAYSPKMLQGEYAIAQFEISKDEFIEKAHKDDVICAIGHPDTAQMFGFEENRQTIILKPNDILYVCEMNNDTGTRLPVGITEISQLPNGFFFRFLEIRVFQIPSEISDAQKQS